MELSTYHEQARRTWRDTDPHDEQVAHALLGLVGEVGEYLIDRNPEESGDVIYYAVILIGLVGDRLNERWLSGPHELDEDAYRSDSGTIMKRQFTSTAPWAAEVAKKLVFQGEASAEHTDRIRDEAIDWLQWIASDCSVAGVAIRQVMKWNINTRCSDHLQKMGGYRVDE